MNSLKLLIVEDNDRELTTCRDTVDRYVEEKKRNVELVECKTIDEALKALDGSFDGTIIDLRLADQGNEGNQVIEKIEESFFRIPVAILTATPENVQENFTYIGVFTKGAPGAGYYDLLDRFWEIYETGLTRIMGGRGLIEERLSEVFRKNLLPQKDKWVEYGEIDSDRTEKALLRHTLNHLSQLLDDDGDRCFPEEMYLAPPLTDNTRTDDIRIRTGSIVKEKQGDKWFVVMNPACDLVLRENDRRNTDRTLVVEIDPETKLFPWFEDTNLSKNKQGDLESAFKNHKSTYYHWLPKTDFFEGGFLNFRKLSTLEIDKFSKRFETPPQIQIAPSFIKDVIARFSSYYARQGQPDIDSSKFFAKGTEVAI